MGPRAARRIERLFLATGLAFLLAPVWAWAYGAAEQAMLMRRWEVGPPASPLVAASETGPGPAVPGEVVALSGDDPVIRPSSANPPAPEKSVRDVVPAFIITIPRIGLRAVVVEGTTLADLRRGPGHYPGTALPGEVGNVAIAGHRTTYGAWFRHLDRLKPGDAILLSTKGRVFRYAVEGEQVVGPAETGPVLPTDYAALTLTTCTPPGSATMRLVVRARLVPSTGGP